MRRRIQSNGGCTEQSLLPTLKRPTKTLWLPTRAATHTHRVGRASTPACPRARPLAVDRRAPSATLNLCEYHRSDPASTTPAIHGGSRVPRRASPNSLDRHDTSWPATAGQPQDGPTSLGPQGADQRKVKEHCEGRSIKGVQLRRKTLSWPAPVTCAGPLALPHQQPKRRPEPSRRTILVRASCAQISAIATK